MLPNVQEILLSILYPRNLKNFSSFLLAMLIICYYPVGCLAWLSLSCGELSYFFFNIDTVGFVIERLSKLSYLEWCFLVVFLVYRSLGVFSKSVTLLYKNFLPWLKRLKTLSLSFQVRKVWLGLYEFLIKSEIICVLWSTSIGDTLVRIDERTCVKYCTLHVRSSIYFQYFKIVCYLQDRICMWDLDERYQAKRW